MLKQRKSIVGLDIGSSCIKAVELTRDKYDHVITGYAQVDVQDEAARQDAIAELMRVAKFRTKRIATAVSGKNVVFRYISLPEMGGGQAGAGRPPRRREVHPVRRQRRRTGRAEDRAWATDANGKARDEGAAGRRQEAPWSPTIQPHADRAGSAAGRSSASTDSRSATPGSSATWCNPGIQDPGRTVALIDIGATKASINILRDNVSCFAREVPMGGQDLTNAIARRLGVEPGQAETLKRDAGEQLAVVQEACGQVLEDLGNEVNLSFDFFENQFDGEVQEVWLTGGTALLPFLEESFEKIFEKRTKTWNPDRGPEGPRRQRRRRSPEPTGAAARGRHRSRRSILRRSAVIRINLLPADLRRGNARADEGPRRRLRRSALAVSACGRLVRPRLLRRPRQRRTAARLEVATAQARRTASKKAGYHDQLDANKKDYAAARADHPVDDLASRGASGRKLSSTS